MLVDILQNQRFSYRIHICKVLTVLRDSTVRIWDCYFSLSLSVLLFLCLSLAWLPVALSDHLYSVWVLSERFSTLSIPHLMKFLTQSYVPFHHQSLQIFGTDLSVLVHPWRLYLMSHATIEQAVSVRLFLATLSPNCKPFLFIKICIALCFRFHTYIPSRQSSKIVKKVKQQSLAGVLDKPTAGR